MTQPPPSGPWGAQQPGQPHGQQPGQWSQGQGYQGGPGQFGPPPQQWPAPVPPKKGGAGKWILGAVALVAVIAVTAVVAVSCSKSDGNGGGGGTAAPNKSGIASANDTGPVGIITEDPSCAPWGPVATTLSNAESNGWDKRDPSIPATSWTPEQQSQYQAVAQAMRSAADQTVPLAKLTTHRVMRELYEQFIAYSRAYADSIPSYTAADEHLNGTASTITLVVSDICDAISYGSAAARAPLVPVAVAPTHIASPGDPANPTRFMLTTDESCPDWQDATTQVNSDPAYLAWQKEDASIPASSWSDQYKSENQAVIPVFNRLADTFEALGHQSSNPTVEDFGTLAAQYFRAYVAAIPTYTRADGYLNDAASRVPILVKAACSAAGKS